MLASMQGQKFFTFQTFTELAEKQCFGIIDLAQEVMDSNLEEEKRRLKAGLGIPQQPCPKLAKFTEHEISNMKGKELNVNLKALGFPQTGYGVAEKKKILWYLTCETEEERNVELKQMYGNKEFVRGLISADGSWLRRSYSSAARSPCGQALIIGSLTRSIIGWGFRVMKCSRENTDHACAVNHFSTVKSMESQIIVECVNTLLSKGFVPAEIALDGDATTFSALLRTFVKDVRVRQFGGEVVIDMKADDRHLLTTIKDHLFKINKQHTIVQKSKANITPMSEPHDCYYLSKLVNLVKCQVRGQKGLTDQQRTIQFQKLVKNIVCHYFNDQPGTHYSCEHAGYVTCQVVQARLFNGINWFIRSFMRKGLSKHLPGNNFVKLVAEFAEYNETVLPSGREFISMSTVKTKLQDNKWLGERCVDANHRAAFRKSIAAEFSGFCELKMAKKVLRENDTQVNESAHSSQTRINRKDINQGRCTEYPGAMAAGVLKVSLGQPSRATTYFDQRHNKLTKLANYKKSKEVFVSANDCFLTE